MPADADELSRPRLRLLKHTASRMQDSSTEATPQAGPGPGLARAIVVRDDEEDELPTPRMQHRPINSDNLSVVPAETPAARLRALLAREPRSSRFTAPSLPPAPPSEADSFAGPPRLGSSSSSVARESLRNIFSRALREPGDTPERNRQRRNSFDGSSMEITPVVDRDRGQRRAPRRSLSDEEADKPKSSRQSDRSFRFSTAASFDALRARLMSSQSQLMDQNLPQALGDPSDDTSDSRHRSQASTSSQFNPTRVIPSVTSDTPHPSFQMSSQLAFHSNLLEQDSEMQRAMGDVLNSETEASTPSIAQPIASSLRENRSNSRLEHGRAGIDSASTSFLDSKTDRDHRSQEEEHNHQRERVWNRPRVPSRTSTPEMNHRHSHEFHRRLSQEIRSPSHTKSSSHDSPVAQSTVARPGYRHLEKRSSIVSLRSFDDDHSSRPSSIGSQADHRERISELERDRNHEREREWNKHRSPSPSSSLSTSSNHSFSHSYSHPPRSPSTTPYSAPTHASLQRKPSRSSLRSDSPASLASSHDSLKEREQEEANETNQERERNWNSPRPHWSISKSPPASSIRPRNNSLRATPSLTRFGNSSGHQGASPKAGPSTTPSTPHTSRDRADSGLDENATRSTPLNEFSPSKTSGAASKFGWNFARSPLPPLELDDHRRSAPSPSPGSQPSNKTSEAVMSSQIPIRSRMKSFTTAGYATSDMSLTNVAGDESSFQNEVAVKSPSRGPATAGNSRSREDTVLASDEESVDDLPPQSTTPKSNPPRPLPEEIETDTETEILSSPSGSPRFGAPVSIPDEVSLQKADDPPRAQILTQTPEEPSVSASATPPGTPLPIADLQLPTSKTPPASALVTPPRETSYANSILDFRTPSPPHDLPDLPGPPSSDDDALGSPIKDRRLDADSNITLTKTPKPPGAWAATPLPPKSDHRPPFSVPFFPLESTPPVSTSTPLPRASSLPPAHIETETDHRAENGLLTPVASWSRAKTLPLRTPAPPGAWLATPGQSALLSNGIDQSQYGSLARRKGLLKVRFDVTESEASTTEEHTNSPLSAVRLTNPELPLPRLNIDLGADATDAGENEVPQASSTPRRPATPERPTTPTSRDNPSPRSLRRSPAVRVVDAFGRERVDAEEIAAPLSDLPNGHADVEKTSTPSTPRRSLVRIVDAMGREVDEAVEMPNAPEDRENRLFEADVSVVSDDSPDGYGDTVSRLQTTLRDLTESEADRSRALVSRSKNATAKRLDLRKNKAIFARTRGLSPVANKRSWNTTLICCGVIMQLLLILAMWRYANVEARRLFYTTYYDPLYPELTPIQGSSCLSGTLSPSRSYEIIRQEGWWSIGQEMFRAMRHVGEQAWERWGEHAHFEKPT